MILDFDGVIVDSLPAHLDAWHAAVEAVFKKPLTDAERLVGHATRTIAHMLAKHHGDPSRATELALKKRLLLAERYGTLPLFPGVREFLGELAARGIPYGVASNSPRAFVVPVIAALRLPIEVVHAADDLSRGKPHPDIFWACGNALRVEPRERAGVLVFEDSFHGLEAARAAGMFPVGVASAHTETELMRAGARRVCVHLGDALAQGWLAASPALEPE